MNSIRALIVDDHAIVTEGVAALLRNTGDMHIAGVCTSGTSALLALDQVSVEVVITDITMPDMSGIDLTIAIGRRWPTVRVLALSMHAEKPFVTAMFQAGARGYLLKECMFGELETAIRQIVDGGTYVSSQIGHLLNDSGLRQNRPGSVFEQLTARERQVLQLIAQGMSSQSIADQLRISVKTVESHRGHIGAKLELRNVADLTRYAIREGLVTP